MDTEIKNSREGCEGCNAYYDCIIHRLSHLLSIDCPCKTCLIKCMCSEQCNDFNIFEDHYIDILEKEEI